MEEFKTLNNGKILNLRKNITIIDGSHNQDGAYVLNQYLETKTFIGKWNLIIGMLNNREVKILLKYFKKHINQIRISIAIDNSYEQKNSLSALDIKMEH